MALEKVFIHRHVLDRDDPLERLDLDDAINQQERVTVRNDGLNLSDVHEVWSSEFGVRSSKFECATNLKTPNSELRNSKLLLQFLQTFEQFRQAREEHFSAAPLLIVLHVHHPGNHLAGLDAF